MHSFLRVVETLAHDGAPGPFLISTVDTVAPAGAYRRFIEEAERHSDAAVTLALTTAIDDEKPLLVRRDGARIVALGAEASGGIEATAGYYAVGPAILAEADAARRDGLDALRKLFERLLARGYRLDGVTMPDSIDVDRPVDVASAERLLAQVAR
jgi:choline kinase